jgi:hypothetical protein
MEKDLVEIIKANPGCVAIIDNDSWALEKVDGTPLANDGDTFYPPLGDGDYGSGHCYGGDILQALAKIVGITVTSV